MTINELAITHLAWSLNRSPGWQPQERNMTSDEFDDALEYVVILSDTITYRRTVEVRVKAKSMAAAKADVLARADEIMSEREDVEEEQIDNTLYEVIAYP